MAAKNQFSLQAIFVVTVLAALVAAEASAFPDWLADFVAWTVASLIPPATIAGIIYARGAAQAFWIGASVWWVIALVAVFFGGVSIHILDAGRIDTCLYWLMDIAGGLVAVVVRWLAVGGDRSPPAA